MRSSEDLIKLFFFKGGDKQSPCLWKLNPPLGKLWMNWLAVEIILFLVKGSWDNSD